jgi:long-chain acyl-CoA synthetase
MNAQNSSGFFQQEFASQGERTAIIWRDQPYTYKHILERIDHWRSKLSFLEAGTIVGLEGDFYPESIAILFVLIERNIIVVPLDINQQKKNETKYQIANIEVLIRFKTESDIEILQLSSKPEKHALYQLLIERKVPGLVLFTSGSSGQPKAALHDFSKLLEKFRVKRKALVTINFLLFDHWGGLNTLFHILSNGGTVVILENRQPDYVCVLIEKYKVELLPTSPTFLNMLLLSRAYERNSIDSLKIISYGSEPMPENILKHLNRQFPNITFQQTYGLIELGVMRSKSEDNGSLWVKLGGEGYQTRVVDGMLQIKSDSAMIGYLNADSPFTDDGWFMTGDAVEVKGDYFKILGRRSEIINVGGEKVYPQEVENVILENESVLDVFIFAEPNPITGKMVCAKIVLKEGADQQEVIKEVKRLCRLKLAPFKVPMRITVTNETLHGDRFKKLRKF